VQIAKQYTPEIEQTNQEIATLKNEVIRKEKETDALYETYISEAEGRKGTLLIGKGPVYTEKRQKHDAALAELKQLKIANNNKILLKEVHLASLVTSQKNQESKTQPIITNFDGLMARISGLGKLPIIPSLFIFLLFLAIETSPILAKLIAPKGEYDYKLEDEENAIKNWVAQKVDQRNELLNTDIIINKKVYEDISEEEEIYKYKRKKARELMQLQADAFYKKQQKML
jgi:hypothetical protein